MAYDEELADRIRTLLGGRAGLTEQKMFVERGTAYAGSLPPK